MFGNLILSREIIKHSVRKNWKRQYILKDYRSPNNYFCHWHAGANHVLYNSRLQIQDSRLGNTIHIFHQWGVQDSRDRGPVRVLKVADIEEEQECSAVEIDTVTLLFKR